MSENDELQLPQEFLTYFTFGMVSVLAFFIYAAFAKASKSGSVSEPASTATAVPTLSLGSVTAITLAGAVTEIGAADVRSAVAGSAAAELGRQHAEKGDLEPALDHLTVS